MTLIVSLRDFFFKNLMSMYMPIITGFKMSKKLFDEK